MNFGKSSEFLFIIVFALFFHYRFCTADFENKIAILLPESGKYSAIGNGMKESIFIAADKKFEKQKPNIQLIYYDNYSNPDSAASIAKRIAKNPDFIGILGGYPSSCAFQTMLIAERYQISYLIVSSSVDSLTNRQLDYTFRMAPLSSDYNDGLVSWAASIVPRGRNISVIHDGENHTLSAVVDICSDLKNRWSGKVEMYQFRQGQNYFDELIERQRKLRPDLVWLIGSTNDIARFLKECRKLDWSPIAFVFGNVNLVNNRIISLADGAANYVFAPAVWTIDVPYPGAAEFTEAYSNITGNIPDYHAAEAFAGIEVLSSALQKCEFVERDNLRDKLGSTNILSIFGKVSFDDFRGFRNQNRSRSVCVQLLDQRWQSVWPRELARSRYIYPPPDWRERNRPIKMVKTNPLLYYLFIILTIVLLVLTFKRGNELRRKMGSK